MLSRRSFLAATGIFALGAARPERASAAVSDGPSEILLIRHAEKPGPDRNVHLSERGRARAEALPTLFPSRFARPDFLFASHQSKLSNHAYETLEPLARTLHLQIDAHLSDEKSKALARLLRTDPRYRGAHVLIAWHHESLPRLAAALGATDVPRNWRDRVYDRIWRLRMESGLVTFDEQYQHLLPGDRAPR